MALTSVLIAIVMFSEKDVTKPSKEAMWLINHRLMSVAAGLHALSITSDAGLTTPKLTMIMEGNKNPIIEGTIHTYVGPTVEIAAIHTRALMEFLGLQAVKADRTRIQSRKTQRQPDDLGVEQFTGRVIDLAAFLAAHYRGPAADAEKALGAVFWTTNKGLAHSTSHFQRGEAKSDLLFEAFCAVPGMMRTAFYAPLRIPFPAFPFEHDPHPAFPPLPWPPSP